MLRQVRTPWLTLQRARSDASWEFAAAAGLTASAAACCVLLEQAHVRVCAGVIRILLNKRVSGHQAQALGRGVPTRTV